LGYAIEHNSIPYYDWRASGLGYSRNTIGEAYRDEMVNAITKGAVMIHGVKERKTLEAAKGAYGV